MIDLSKMEIVDTPPPAPSRRKRGSKYDGVIDAFRSLQPGKSLVVPTNDPTKDRGILVGIFMNRGMKGRVSVNISEDRQNFYITAKPINGQQENTHAANS